MIINKLSYENIFVSLATAAEQPSRLARCEALQPREWEGVGKGEPTGHLTASAVIHRWLLSLLLRRLLLRPINGRCDDNSAHLRELFHATL